MGCLKLTYHKNTELKVSYIKKELTLKNSAVNERSYLKARYYDPRISIFVSVDPLAEKFVGWTPYHYVHNNPINLIDPTGMSAEGPGDPPYINNYGVLLTPKYRHMKIGPMKSKVFDGYRFKPAAAHLLSLVTGVDKKYINSAKVNFKSTNMGGSITTGSSQSTADITHYSGEEATKPTNIIAFLQRNAHEIGHIPQLKDGNLKHLWSSGKEYLQNILNDEDWHDGSFSSKEREADIGENIFREFNSFVDENYGKNEMKKLFESEKSEKTKIETIDKWYKSFEEKNK